ncbi:DUF3578 domain-containing protein [Kitasatospora albolonga]|uniref:MrcB family domain-containing protein n=1 Tax=Kitasatospora albolonga TaxID=68173 RepID=UPI0031EFE2DE
MDFLMREVLDLQPSWSADKTPEMDRRGAIVRQELPRRLRELTEALADELGLPADDVGVEGKSSTGRNSVIPWVRVHSEERSPSATVGWYVVYLFSASGDRVYLSLNQGTTVWTGTVFAKRSPDELKARVEWARPLVEDAPARRPGLVRSIDLQGTKGKLSRGYEAGNVVAIEYSADEMPAEEVLTADLLFMAELLGRVYEGERLGIPVPGESAPEVLDLLDVTAAMAGRRVGRSRGGRGQGFRLTAEERKAVELRAMGMATEHFERQGWTVEDVGARESYDLELRRGDSERLHVEVKGTTSAGEQVVLTRAEVERQREFFPENALVVVHSIALDGSEGEPRASGGVLTCVSPWWIEDEDLSVVSYLYRTPA